MSERIFQIKEVELLILESFPPQLMINVSGFASTSGWTQPELRVDDNDPSDGVYEYEFVATPPRGIALQVLTPITASLHLGEIPQDFKGVKIHASSNSVEQKTASQKSKILEEQTSSVAERTVERLIGFRHTDDKLIIRVKSGGCTQKEHFKVEINSGFTGMSPVFATVYRLTPDHCKANIPNGIEVEFTFEELGLPDDTDIIVVNPVGKANQRRSGLTINVPSFPPQPFPWPVTPSPRPLPDPQPIPWPTNPFPWPTNPFPWPTPSPRPQPDPVPPFFNNDGFGNK